MTSKTLRVGSRRGKPVPFHVIRIQATGRWYAQEITGPDMLKGDGTLGDTPEEAVDLSVGA